MKFNWIILRAGGEGPSILPGELTYLESITFIFIAVLILFFYFIHKQRKRETDKSTKTNFTGRVFDYHEDDFCNVEFIPVENLQELTQDFKEIEDINLNHFSSYGFSKIHDRNDKKVKTLERGISIQELEGLLDIAGLEKFDFVTTGYGSQQYESEHSMAFGDEEVTIILERNKLMVQHIWARSLYPPRWKNETKKIMKNLLQSMGSKWNLMLVDWSEKHQIEISNSKVVDQYVNGEFH